MRHVSPNTRLIARPEVNWEEVSAYLSDIEARDYLNRVDGRFGHVPDSEELIEFGGRLCYRSWEPGLNPNVTRVREDHDAYLDNVLSSGHGSVIEHANWSFLFENVSRVFTHELVRHRAGVAISQESMRFVRLTDIPFWFPTWAQEDEALMRRSVRVLHMLEDHQTWMAGHFGLDDQGVPFAEKKAKTSFMRRFAPDGVATSLLGTFNARALRHIIFMRTAPGAEEEIRLVIHEVAKTMQGEAPGLFADFECKDVTDEKTGAVYRNVWTTPYIKV